jgi:6-phosphogluconolactonase/glucosamine-6-phosphate isomerase/deaminase
MEVIITPTYEEMSKVSAELIAREIKRKHDLVLGLATGDTPIGTYKELVKLHKEQGLDFSKITTFNLDEYIGLHPLHKNSYNYFMKENLFKHINVNQANVYVPQGHTDDPEEFSAWYEDKIKKAGGIDFQILGIGRDGHNGEKKAEVVAQFIEGPVTSQITATALQLHSFATVVLDEAAASKLTRTEYYNWVRDNKHRVQKMVGR